MPEQSTTLRDMIQRERERRGTPYRRLAELAIDPVTGERVSYSTINNLVLGKTDRMPQVEHIRAIAVALDVPYEQVRQAAIAQWLPPMDDEDAERERLELLAEAKRLRDQANETIARLEQQERDEEQHGGRRAG